MDKLTKTIDQTFSFFNTIIFSYFKINLYISQHNKSPAIFFIYTISIQL